MRHLTLNILIALSIVLNNCGTEDDEHFADAQEHCPSVSVVRNMFSQDLEDYTENTTNDESVDEQEEYCFDESTQEHYVCDSDELE